MSPTTMFIIGIVVQLVIAILQVSVAFLFVYRWQKNSWRFSNLMNIRGPLARAYCSLSAVLSARKRLAEETDPTLAEHDRVRIQKTVSAAQDEILNFSIEHFKAKFWMRGVENTQLDVLFDKLSSTWKAIRTENETADDSLNGLRKEILRFDALCGLENYNGGMWSHVALHT
ncbi:MAG: hypothetical protein ABSH08_14430 [Tepidisphaeraceae bacterium]